jgi:transcriptional regulator with XRE-family HTH domain
MAKPTVALSFGKVLQKQRKAKGFSQEALAEKAQVHPTYIGLVERGLRNPSLNVAASLAKALGFSLSEMISQAEKLQRGN